MDQSSLHDALDRWLAAGLIDPAQAEGIAAHEAALAPLDSPAVAHPERARIDVGAVLAYAGTLVALAAVFALYVTVFQDYTERARIALMFAVAAGAAVLAFGASRFRAGESLADALGLATTLIAAWATGELFRATGWLGDLPRQVAPGYGRAVGELRGALLGIGLVGTVVGYAAARGLRSPLSAAASAVGLAWAAGVTVWWLADPGAAAPGIPGGQAIVIVGDALALATLVPGVVGLRDRGRFWWQLGALGAANVAAFALAVSSGGIYEGLLLAYAIGLAAVAILRGGRLFLVAGAVALYEYVGVVIFRTFQGAVAAIVVLALVGLGTAFAGGFGQRVGFAWLWRWTAPRRPRPPAPEASQEPEEPPRDATLSPENEPFDDGGEDADEDREASEAVPDAAPPSVAAPGGGAAHAEEETEWH